MFTYQGQPVSPLSQVPMDSYDQYQNVAFGRSPDAKQVTNNQSLFAGMPQFTYQGQPANPLSQVPMDTNPNFNTQQQMMYQGQPFNSLSQVPMDPNTNFNPRPPTQSFFTGQTIVPTNTVNPMSQMPGDEFLNMVKPNKQVEQMPQQQMPTMERPQQEQFLPNQLPNVPVPGVLGQTGSMFNNLLNNTNPVLQAPIIQTPSTVTKSPSNLGQVIGKQLTRPTMSRTPIRQPVVQRRPVTRSAPRIVR